MNLTITVYNSVCQVLPRLDFHLSAELDALLAFGVEGARFTAAYVNNKWDGKKHLYSTAKQAFPTGYLVEVYLFFKQKGIEPVIVDRRDCPTMDGTSVKLRGKAPWRHQIEVFSAMAKQCRGLIQVATGGGKTFCIAGAYALFNQPGIVLTYRRELMFQLRHNLQEFLGEPVGIFGDGQWEEGRLTVCMAQSLLKATNTRYAKLLKEFEEQDEGTEKLAASRKIEIWDKLIKATRFVALDECLPYRQRIATEIGPIEIGKVVKMYERGDAPRVWSLDNTTGVYELQPITYTWRRPNKPCVRINYGRASFTVTKNHPVLTSRGYVPAGDIKIGDKLIGRMDQKKRQNNLAAKLNPDQLQVLIGSYLGDGCIRKLPSGHYRLSIVHGPKQKAYAEMKAKIFGARMHTARNKGFAPNNLCHQFNTRIIDMPGDISGGKKTHVPQWMIDAMDARALAIWVMDDGSLQNDGGVIHSYTFDEDSHTRLVAKLNSMGVACRTAHVRHRNSIYPCIRLSSVGGERIRNICGAYGHPCLSYKLPKIGRYHSWDCNYLNTSVAIVTHISNWIPKNSKHGTGIYDIEVRKNHNFIVAGGSISGGICVHNCHHLGANSSYMLVQSMENAYWRYGFSATAFGYRDDGKDFFVKAAVGDVLVKVTTSDLVDDGILVPTDVIMLNYSHAGHHYPKDSYTDYYTKAVVENEERNKLIIRAAHHLYRAGKPVLIAVQRVDHGKWMELAMRHLAGEQNVRFLHGEDSPSYRTETLKLFAEGKLPVLISTLISEGVDIPHLAYIIGGRGEESRIATIQLMGRGMRSYPDKKKAVYVDIMDYRTKWLGRHSRTRDRLFRSERAFNLVSIESDQFADYLRSNPL